MKPTINITCETDVRLNVTLMHQGEVIIPQLIDNLQAYLISGIGVRTPLQANVKDDYIKIDVPWAKGRLGCHSLMLKGYINGLAWAAVGKAVIRYTSATEKGADNVTLQADAYDITMEVGYHYSDTPIARVEATIDSQVGEPEVDIRYAAKVLSLAFRNIKGNGIASIIKETDNTGDGAVNTWRINLDNGQFALLSLQNGSRGNGIASITPVSISQEDGGVSSWSINETDGRSTLFYVRNGNTGPAGPQGASAVFDPETGNILATLHNTTGQDDANAMTQKAVTDELRNITDAVVKTKTTSDIIYNAGRVNGANWNVKNNETNPSDGFYMNVVAYRGMRVKITPQSGKRVRVGFTQNILIKSGATTTGDYALVDGTSVSNGTAIVYADGYSNVIYPAADVAIDVTIPDNCNYLWCSYLYGSSGDIRPLSIEFFESKTINILNTELREVISTSAEETSANVLAAAENSIGLVNFHPTTEQLGGYSSGNGYYIAKENGVWVWKAETSNYTGRTLAWSDPATKGMSILVVPQENQFAYIAFVKSSPIHDDGIAAGDEVEFCEGWERVKVDKPTVFTIPIDEGNLRFFYMVKYNGNGCGPQYYQRGYTISESLDKHNERISNLETLSIDGKEAASSTRTGVYILKEAYTSSNCGNTTKSTAGYLWLIPNKGYASLECKNLYSWVKSYGAQITLFSEMEISHQYFIKDISQGDTGLNNFSLDLTPYKDTCKLIVVASSIGSASLAEITLKIPMMSIIENLSKDGEGSSSDDTVQNTVKDVLGQARYGYTYTYTPQPDTNYTIPIKAVTFLHFSDLHGDEQSMQAIKSFLDANSSLIDDAVNTGDTLNTAWYTSSEEEPADNSWGIYEEVGLDCAIHAVGNHDRRSDYGVTSGSTASYRRVSKQQAYERYFANAGTWGLTVPGDVNAPYLMFGYKDYPFTDIVNILGNEAANFTGTLGVRLIILDGESILNDGASSINTAYNNAQISLFRTALKDARDNKLMVVVASHYIPGTYVDEGIVKKADGEKVSFHAYGNSSATSINSTFRLPSDYGQAVQDFIDGVSMMGEEVDSENPVHGKFAVWLCGHYHQDKLAYASKSFASEPSENTPISDVLFSAINKSGYNSKDATAGRAKDKYRYCANIVTIQPYYSTIKIQRIGINMDNRLRPINVLSYTFSWNAEKRKVIANY